MALETLQSMGYVITSLAFAMGTASNLVRFYSRWKFKALGWDDAAAGLLLLMNVMQQTILYTFLHYGCGRHAALLSTLQQEHIKKWLFIEEIFYMLMHLAIKVVSLMFYLRIFPQRKFRLAVYGAMAFTAASTVVSCLLAGLQCTPFDAILHPAQYSDAECMDTHAVLITPSALNIIDGLVVLALPIPNILALQMSRRRKALVLGIICFGFLPVITAFCRIVILNELAIDPDTPFVLGKMIIVASIEIEVAVVAVNLPAVSSMIARLRTDAHLPPAREELVLRESAVDQLPDRSPWARVATQQGSDANASSSMEKLLWTQIPSGATSTSHSPVVI